MPGYQDSKGLISRVVADDLLYSTSNKQEVTVCIDKDAVDAAHSGNTRYLRRGLVMAKVSATGKYRQYDDGASNGTELEDDVVILGQDVLLNGTDDQTAMCYRAAVVRKNALIYKDGGAEAAIDWTKIQRIDRI